MVKSMSRQPTISLAILTRNTSNALRTTLIEMQDFIEHFNELIICDDASGESEIDAIHKICEKFRLKVTVLTCRENIGTFENLKRAFVNSAGDFTCFMSAGDALTADYLHKILRLPLNSSKKVAYVPKKQEIFENNRGDVYTPKFTGFRKLDGIVLARHNLSHGGGAIYPTKLVLNSRVFKVSGFQLMEDYLIWVLLNQSGFKIKRIDDVLYLHRTDSSANLQAREVRNQRYLFEVFNLLLREKSFYIQRVMRQTYYQRRWAKVTLGDMANPPRAVIHLVNLIFSIAFKIQHFIFRLQNFRRSQ
jgi:glycosyltransferase involved in cell wall biosynthesis